MKPLFIPRNEFWKIIGECPAHAAMLEFAFPVTKTNFDGTYYGFDVESVKSGMRTPEQIAQSNA